MNTKFIVQFAAVRKGPQQQLLSECHRYVFGGCRVLSNLLFQTIDSFPRILICTAREIENTLLQHNLSTANLWFEFSHDQSSQSQPFTTLDGLDLIHEVFSEEHGQYDVQLCVVQHAVQPLFGIFSRHQEIQHPSRHCSQIRSQRQ